MQKQVLTQTVQSSLTTGVGLELAWPEVIGNPGDDTEVVLAIIYRIWNAAIAPIDFTQSQSKSVLESRGNAAAGEHGKCIAVNRELEVDVLPRSAEHDLSIGNIPA